MLWAPGLSVGHMAHHFSVAIVPGTWAWAGTNSHGQCQQRAESTKHQGEATRLLLLPDFRLPSFVLNRSRLSLVGAMQRVKIVDLSSSQILTVV